MHNAAASEMSTLSLPILALSRTDGDQVLRGYKLTPDEQKLFKELDAATCLMLMDAPIRDYHDVAARIGEKYGLTRQQSVAFFMRAMLSTFEEAEG